jgi:hypothetical protein
MKKSFRILPLFGFVFSLLLTGCANLNKLVEQGRYDEAVRIAQRQLAGKKNKDPEKIAAFAEAFHRANDRDLARAERLKRDGNTDDWGQIVRLYDQVLRRQEAVAPLLPLVDKYGVPADIRFVKVAPLLNEARGEAAAYHYREGQQLLERARAGDKSAARAAYAEFSDVGRYRNDYRDIDQLQDEAYALGIVYVKMEVANRSGAILPAGFDRELLRLNTGPMESRWRRFHLAPEPGIEYDYRARIEITGLQVSPERITERSYLDEKEIEDGWEYVLDERGNVAKDSLGNDIRVPRQVVIRAQVLEVFQEKTAWVGGRMELFDNRTGRLIESRDLTAEAIFENYASTFQGDRRALSSTSRRRIGNRPVDFPTDEQLILDAAARLKPVLQENLAASSRLL